MLDEHKRSKKHKKTEKEYLQAHPEESLSSIFKSITFETSHDALSDLQLSLMGANEPLSLEEDSNESKTSVPTKTTLESLRICLFCNKESEGVKKNLDHMRH